MIKLRTVIKSSISCSGDSNTRDIIYCPEMLIFDINGLPHRVKSNKRKEIK